MSNLLLEKPISSNDFIDAAVGEAHVVRDALFSVFDMKNWQLSTSVKYCDYPCSSGYKPLVDLLEWKHGAKVVITNGAKQGLSACLYALKQMNKTTVGMKSPYWALLPQLIKMHGLEWTAAELSDGSFYDSYLCLSPNNPDGSIVTTDIMRGCKTTLIHDAVYNTYSYLPRTHSISNIGDVQLYSASKSFGLSGFRIGYAVCHNLEYYKLIKEYVEATTVGVSIPSQMFVYELMNQMRGYPTLVQKFEDISFAALQESKKIIQEVSPEILEIPANYTDVAGMFGWFKVGPKADFQKSKINVIDGALFGGPGMVRMNLAFSAETMRDIVTRLNSVLV